MTIVNKTIDLLVTEAVDIEVDGGAIEIPSFFCKSGYQGYKIFLDRMSEADDIMVVETYQSPY